MRALPVLIALLMLAGCGGEPPRPTATQLPPLPGSDDEARAQARLDAVEREVARASAHLRPADSFAAQRALGGTLESALRDVAGTKAENRVLILLASWRFEFAAAEGVDQLLDRLEQARGQYGRNLAPELRLRLRLRQGRLAEARALAARVRDDLPELAASAELIRFYDLIGGVAPRTAGANLAGGPADPATRPEPYLLYLFAPALDEATAFWLQRWFAELRRPAHRGQVRPVVVAFDATPGVLPRLRAIPGGEDVDLLWAAPTAQGDGTAWQQAWRLAQLPSNALLGPRGDQGRPVMGVHLYVEDLAPALGVR